MEGLTKAQIKELKKEGSQKYVQLKNMSKLSDNRFFMIDVSAPSGNFEQLQYIMNIVNTPANRNEQDNPNGPWLFGKVLLSAGDDKLTLIAHVPANMHDQLTPSDWLCGMLPNSESESESCNEHLSNSITTLENGTIAYSFLHADHSKNIYPLKIRDTLISNGFTFLRQRNLISSNNDSDDDNDVEFDFDP